MILEFKKELIKAGRIIDGVELTSDKYFIKAITDDVVIKKFEEDLTTQELSDALFICKRNQIHLLDIAVSEVMDKGYNYNGTVISLNDGEKAKWNAYIINATSLSYPHDIIGENVSYVTVSDALEAQTIYGTLLTYYQSVIDPVKAKKKSIIDALTFEEVLAITYD